MTGGRVSSKLLMFSQRSSGLLTQGLGWASEKIERSEIFERAAGARQRRHGGDEDPSRPCFVLKTLQSASVETQFKPCQ